MSRHEIADILVEPAGSDTELACSFIEKCPTCLLVEISFFVGEEDIFHKAFDFIVTGGDSIFDPCFLDSEAIGEEALGKAIARLEEHSHLLKNGTCQNIGVLDDVFVKIVAGNNPGFAWKRSAIGDFHRDFLDVDGLSLEFLLGNALSGDFHDRFAGEGVANIIPEEDQSNEEEDQNDDHEAGVFADIFNHGRRV